MGFTVEVGIIERNQHLSPSGRRRDVTDLELRPRQLASEGHILGGQAQCKRPLERDAPRGVASAWARGPPNRHLLGERLIIGFRFRVCYTVLRQGVCFFKLCEIFPGFRKIQKNICQGMTITEYNTSRGLNILNVREVKF